MVHQLLNSSVAESLLGLADQELRLVANYFVYEVNGSGGYPLRILLDLHLFGQDLLPDLLSVLPVVWALPN